MDNPKSQAVEALLNALRPNAANDDIASEVAADIRYTEAVAAEYALRFAVAARRAAKVAA